jgi:N-acetylglucosamine-6-phosphate deacetylase
VEIIMKIKGISVYNGKPIEVKIRGGFIENINSLPGSGHNLPYVSPGFFDIQVNGYKGSDYNLEDFSEEHLKNIITSLASSGTTQHIPTIVSSPSEIILKNLEIILKAINASPDIKEAIPGVHTKKVQEDVMIRVLFGIPILKNLSNGRKRLKVGL